MNVWEPDILAFEQADQQTPPPLGATVFVGSSTVVMWDTARWFPGLVHVNRGFGGSCMGDSRHYADRVIIRYQPSLVVLYAGDNDIAGGLTPEHIHSEFLGLYDQVHTALPAAHLLYLTIKPSPSRWSLWPQAQAANELIAGSVTAARPFEVVDTAPALLGSDGTPDPSLYLDDMLHLNDDGYRRFTDIVRPSVARAVGA